MRATIEELERVAGERHPLLLTGEPGVGKRYWARAVHAVTGQGLLQVVDAASVRAEEWPAIEAQGGTLLIVELGKLPEAQQGRLLTLLEAGRIRLLATSTMGEWQGPGHYIRPDLFFRLMKCELPPLRERREDLEELTDQLLAEHASEGRPRLAKEAIGALLLYGWPGNVAELEGVLQRALRLAMEDVIGPGQLPLSVAGYLLPPPPRPLFKRYIRSAELLLIRWALRENKNDRTRAAKWLGISRAALYKKLKLYPEFGTGEGA
jgi:DNA-binding NtrC family response regulator